MKLTKLLISVIAMMMTFIFLFTSQWLVAHCGFHRQHQISMDMVGSRFWLYC